MNNENLGGVVSAQFVLIEEVESSFAILAMDKAIFNVSGTWRNIPASNITVKVTSTGTLYEIEVEIKVPENRINEIDIDLLRKHGVAIRYEKANECMKVVGAKQFPLRCVIDEDEGAATGFSGSILKFTGKCWYKQLKYSE